MRAGPCRLNVEVYGLDDLFLGAVPVEIVAVAGAVSEQEINVGNLVLEVVARQVAALLLGARIAAASSPASLAAADAGSAAMTMPSSSVPIVEGAASQIAAAAGASARPPDTQTYGRLTGRGDPAEQSPGRRLSRVARVIAPLAVVVFAVAVLLTIRGGRETPEPTTVAAPVSAPVQTPQTGAFGTPADARPVAPVQLEPPSANTSKGLIAQGNLIGAARTIVGGLKDNPKNSDLVGALQRVYGAAEAEAINARKAADAAGVKDRPEYADADAQFKSAVSAGASDRSDDKASAVQHYVTAAQQYIDSVNSHALAMFKQGNLNGAARAVTTGLAAAPGDADLRKTLQEILDAAEAGATTAKRSTDVVAGASSRSEYVNATSRLGSAADYRRSGRPGDAEAAVREYGAAEKLFRDAAVGSPPPPVGVGPIVNRAKGLIAQGNLIEAARALVGGLKDNPKNSELTGTIQQLYRTAEADATNARNAADAAGAKDRPEYADANARLQTARYSSRTAGPANAESIVVEFDAAADLYRAAAAKAKTAGPDLRALDELALRKLLNDYVEAYNSMDVQRVRRFKPSFADFPKDLSSTELTISDIRIVLTPDRQTGTVTLTAQYRNTYRKGAVPGPSSAPVLKLTWRVQRTGDAWILLE